MKLGFEYDPPGERYEAERMWVQVDAIDGTTYAGHLVNEPDDPKPGVTYGEHVAFAAENVLDVVLVDRILLPDLVGDPERYPEVPQEREYWERCWVDECVLYDHVPVEYLYREQPDLAPADDKYPDSGWRIRGRKGESDEMDERKPAYVALGAVLNKDDSWLHLIDCPIGSAFIRDFQANTYEIAS